MFMGSGCNSELLCYAAADVHICGTVQANKFAAIVLRCVF